MGSFTLLLLFFLLHLIPAVISSAVGHQLELWANDCSDENGNYTSNSTYKSNLDKLLTKISNTDIPYGFYNFSSGEDPDQINALALCRGDINITECHTCLDFLISRLTSLCSIQMDAIGWAEKCMLRYSPASILGGVWEESPYHNLVTGDVVTVDVDHYQNVVEGLLRTLPNKTAGGDSQLKFATGEAQVNASQKVYALMQCTPDLPTTDCLGCLYWAMYYALRPDKGQTGARILVPSCTVRYESYKFFVSSPPQATPAALLTEESRPEMERCILIALLCVQENPESRPEMSFVIHLLTEESRPALVLNIEPRLATLLLLSVKVGIINIVIFTLDDAYWLQLFLLNASLLHLS